MGILNRGLRHGRYVEIDVTDYVDLNSIVDEEDCIYLRNCLEDASRCLNRPERTASEAIMHIDRALHIIETALTEQERAR